MTTKAEAEAAVLHSNSGSWAAGWPIVNREKTAYADTGVIVAIVMGPSDTLYEEVMRFLKAAERAGVKILVSYLTIAEAIDVLRKRAKMRQRYVDGSARERSGVDAIADAAVADLDNIVRTEISLKRMKILEGQATVAVDFRILAEEIRRQTGRTSKARWGKTYRHEAVGPVDLIHLLLARLAGARVICTTDKAFAQLGDDPRYAGMEFILLGPRPAAARGR